MLPETERTVVPPSTSMDEEDDATELLSESLFHSCMSSFDDNTKDVNKASEEEEEEKAQSSLPDSHILAESRQPQEVTATETAASSDAIDLTAVESTTPEVACAETNNSTGGVNSNFTSSSSSSSSNTSWSLLSESKERPTIHSVTFNRDRTCLLVSTSVGVRIRTLESIHLMNDDGIDNNQSNNLTCDVPLLPDGATYSQILHNTSLIVVIKPSTPRCCYLYNAKSAAFPLAALPLSAAVKRVELTRRVLAALTVDGRVHVFHMADDGGDLTQQLNDAESRKALRPTWVQTLNIMHPSDSCRSLTRGMDIFNVGSYFDLSCEEEQPLLVCKSFNGTSGTIRVYDPTVVEEVSIINKNSSSNVSVGSGAGSNASSWDYYQNTTPTKKKKRRINLLSTIDAHEHSVTRMVIGSAGSQSFLATTSSKGTIVRLFGLPRGDFLWEFHRGSRSCQFYSLAWSGNADRLVTYGSSGTVHVFCWPKEKDVHNNETSNNIEQIEEGNDFQHVIDSSTRSGSVFHPPKMSSEKPLLRRIGESMRQPKKATAPKPLKNRSFAKLKYKPPAASLSNGKKRNPQSQSVIVSLVDRRNDNGALDKNDLAQNEGTLVMCSMDGELRQYTLTNDGHIQLAQLEDVLS